MNNGLGKIESLILIYFIFMARNKHQMFGITWLSIFPKKSISLDFGLKKIWINSKT